MEIKTEKEIWRHVQTEMELRKNNCQTMQEYLNQIEKKWVSVDELIEELEDLHEMRRLELIKQLKGE